LTESEWRELDSRYWPASMQEIKALEEWAEHTLEGGGELGAAFDFLNQNGYVSKGCLGVMQSHPVSLKRDPVVRRVKLLSSRGI